MKRSELLRYERLKLRALQFFLSAALVLGFFFFVFFRLLPTDPDAGKKHVRSSQKKHYINPGDTAYIRSGGTDYEDAIPIEQAESFPFDPNTADSNELRRLGLSTRQIRNLYTYRARRGIYHRPEDFKRLYFLTVEQWHHLQPLIRIGEAYQYLSESPEAYRRLEYSHTEGFEEHYGKERDASYTRDSSYNDHLRAPRDTALYPYKLREGETVELNAADTTQLKRIPGVGSYFARRIVEMRDRLGGFVSISQLSEIENLPIGVEDYLTLKPIEIERIMLNKCTIRQLNAHPYINFYQAKAIITHRRQVGPIRSLHDLSLYEEFPPEALQRLEPYADLTE